MKKTLSNLLVFFILFFIIFGVSVFAQTKKGDFEISGAASFISAQYQYYYYFDNSKHDASFFSIRLAGRLGLFITKNLEIEPEITICKFGENLFGDENDFKMGYILSCNVSYNITPSGKTVPFVLAGVGISNTSPLPQGDVLWGDKDVIYTLINAGAGLKLFLSKTAAIRLEYRFQYYFRGEVGDIKGTYSTYYKTCHYILVGISIFLKKSH